MYLRGLVFRLFAAWLTLPSLAFAETLTLERAITRALTANPDLRVGAAAETGSIHGLLVPIDFREASASALRVAGFIADKRQAVVTVLHAEVLKTPPYFTRGQIEALERCGGTN